MGSERGIYAYETAQATRFYFKYRSANGRSATKRGFTSPRAARRAREQMIVAVSRGEVAPPSRETFGEFYVRWLRERRPYLEPGTAIYPEDLEAWEKQTGVKVEPGDAVFIRTGRWARQKAEGPWDLGKKAAGLDASCVTWLRARDVAVLASDGANELSPPRSDASPVPIHELAIATLGVHLVDNCDLEALGEAAEKYKRWDFLLTIAPLAVVGGTGSPVNPIAAF